jgi:hypothetical protein
MCTDDAFVGRIALSFLDLKSCCVLSLVSRDLKGCLGEHLKPGDFSLLRAAAENQRNACLDLMLIDSYDHLFQTLTKHRCWAHLRHIGWSDPLDKFMLKVPLIDKDGHSGFSWKSSKAQMAIIAQQGWGAYLLLQESVASSQLPLSSCLIGHLQKGGSGPRKDATTCSQRVILTKMPLTHHFMRRSPRRSPLRTIRRTRGPR